MYDVAIIGGGPAGYLAAERLGHLGKKVLLIEKSSLGGTCLNVGCIPTKTLLNSAKQYVHALEAHKFGVKVEGASYDWGAMLAWKNDVVGKLRSGIASQMKRFGVDVIEGWGSITARGAVRVTSSAGAPGSSGGATDYECRAILVSTGSSPVLPPIPGASGNPKLVDSTGLLDYPSVPKRLCVIGGGVIGVEFASLFSALGSEVTVVEMMEEIVPFMDKEQAPILRKAMKAVDFKLGCKVEKLEGATVFYTTKAGAAEKIEADLVLMAVGRRPNISGWGAEAVGLDLSPRGGVPKGIAVDNLMRTNVPGIWAAGDVTGKSLLAHSAYRMAEVAVADIVAVLDGYAVLGAAALGAAALGAAALGASAPSSTVSADRMRYDAIPWAVYGIPEAAGVGITEQEAAARGIEILKASLPMKISGRFVAENTFAAPGAVKVIAEKGSGRILGIHAVGAYASEFIWGGAALIEQELRVQDVKQLIFPHPTVCELIRDAVWEL